MFKQKFHIGDRVYFLDRKYTGTGYQRNAYILRDGIVTGVRIETEGNIVSRKRFDGKDFTGGPDIVRIDTEAFGTRERYRVNSCNGMLDGVQLSETADEVRTRFAEMQEKYPRETFTLEENVEGYEVEFK